MKKALKWIVSFVILAGLGLVLTGLFIDFMQSTSGGITGTVKLFDDIMQVEEAMPTTIVAFSIMTAIFAAGTLALTLLQAGKVVKGKAVRVVLALLTIACAIIAFAVTCAYAAELSISVGGYSVLTAAPAVGAYLLGVGGVVAGLFGLIPVSKK